MPFYVEKYRTNVLGVPVNKISFEQAIHSIKKFILLKVPHHIVTANSLMINSATKDVYLNKILQEANLVVADSVGIVWAANFLKNPLPQRICGIDLFLALCKEAQEYNYRIYLLGTTPKNIERAVEKLKLDYPKLNIVGWRDGFFKKEEEEGIINKINSLSPDLLFVGFNVPFQEKWIYENLLHLGVPVVIGIGGSFDVISGALPRSPLWMQNLGIEWFFRLYLQPFRIFRMLKLPIFVFKVLIQRISKRL